MGPAAIFVVAVLVRGLLLASWMVPSAHVVAPYHVEVEKVARSLVAGHGYADPYRIPTGATAHPLPIQTGLQAFLYLVFGDTTAAAYARALAGIVTCAALFALLPWFAERLGLGRRAGLLGGTAAALVPWQGLGDALGWWWNEANAAIALAVLAAWFLRRWTSSRPPSLLSSAGLGLFAGFAFHLAPALLLVVAGYAAFEAWWTGRAKWRSVAVLTLAAVLGCAPWTWRNYAALGHVFFIRDNFGLELRLGNYDGARADLWSTPEAGRRHPGNDIDEARRVGDVGEGEYMRQARADATSWIRAHPADFLSLTARRAWLVWFGSPLRPLDALPVATLTILALVGLVRAWPGLGPPQRAAIVIALAAYPLVYYVVGYVQRYTYPTVGLLLVLAGAAVAGPRSVRASAP